MMQRPLLAIGGGRILLKLTPKRTTSSAAAVQCSFGAPTALGQNRLDTRPKSLRLLPVSRVQAKTLSGSTTSQDWLGLDAPRRSWRKPVGIARALSSSSSGDDEVRQRLDQMVKAADVVVFMKGVPEAPRCGFSNAVCQIFRMHQVPFESHDVLADEEVRQGIKEYTNWPTIPQVFFKGEFVGGCDILLQMHQSGELVEELQKIGIKSALQTKDGEPQ